MSDSNNNSYKSREVIIDLIAGWTSGALSITLTQPLDTILTRIQASKSVVLGKAKSTTAAAAMTTSRNALSMSSIIPTTVDGNNVARNSTNTVRVQSRSRLHSSLSSRPPPTSSSSISSLSAMHVTKRLVENYGLPSLWRGSFAMIGAIPFQNAFMMAGYGYGKRLFDENSKNANKNLYLGVFVGGCTGGIVQSFLMSPIELIKINQQVIGRSLSSATSMVVSGICSKEMLAWKGITATLLRDGLPHGIWFLSYEYTKHKLETIERKYYSNNHSWDHNDDRKSNHMTSISLCSGAFAAFVAWGVGYPFDIIKTRIQAVATEQTANKRMTVSQAAKQILQESNWRNQQQTQRQWQGQYYHYRYYQSILCTFYRGFWLKIAKAVPASAINFYVYEMVSKQLHDASFLS